MWSGLAIFAFFADEFVFQIFAFSVDLVVVVFQSSSVIKRRVQLRLKTGMTFTCDVMSHASS